MMLSYIRLVIETLYFPVFAPHKHFVSAAINKMIEGKKKNDCEAI